MDRKLVFSFYGKDVSAGRTMNGLSGRTDTLRSKSLAAAKAVGVLAGGAAIAGLTSALRTGFGEVKDYQTGLSQLRAGLKSTHGVAGVTTKGMEALASKIERYSGQTDDSIVKTESLLLTFPDIRNEVGKTNDIFDQTVKLAADMAARMGGDASAQAVKLGKALNDPAKGLTALSKAGVVFTDQQREQIIRLEEHGRTLKAQKVVLAEVNREYAGSARAFGRTLPGQIEKTKRAYEGISQELATDLLPYALKFTKWVRKDALPALEDFGGWVKDHKKELEWFGGILAGLAVSVKALKGVRSLQALVGRGPLAGSGGLLGSAASVARPIPVYVTNSVPGVGGGGTTPVGGVAGGKGASPLGGLKALPLAGVGAISDTRTDWDAVRAAGITPQDFAADSKKLYEATLKQAGGVAKLKQTYIEQGKALKTASGDTQTYTAAAHDALRQLLDDAGALSKYAGIVGNGIGTDLGRGLISGIEAQVPHATYAGKILVQQTVKQMRLAADAHSPSRETEKLGKDLADGLVNGFIHVKAFDKLAVETRHGLMKLSRTTQDALSYRSGMRSGLQDYASLSGRGSTTDSLGASMGSQSTRAYLRGKVQRLREFRDLREKLENRGASPAVLAEYDEIGPDAVPEMRADLHTGRKGIRRINRLEHRANQLAGRIAGDATETAYGDTLTHEVQRLPHRIGKEVAHELEKRLDLSIDLRRLSKKRGRGVRNKS